MRADVGDGPEISRAARLDAPVVIGRVEEPVLDVRAGDAEHATQRASADAIADLPAQWVITDVVIDGSRLGGRDSARVTAARVCWADVANGFSQMMWRPDSSTRLACS